MRLSCKRNLDLLQQEYGVGFRGPGGRRCARAARKRMRARSNWPGLIMADADWFQAWQSKHDYVISDVFLGLRGLPHFIVAVQLRRANGRPWILRATIDFVAFSDLVNNIRIGRTGIAYILNREGKLQTTPGTRPIAGRYPRDGCSAKSSVEQHVRRTATMFGSCLRKDSRGQENIYAGAFLKNGDWLLIYQQSAEDAFADLRPVVLHHHR
ncbi:MAG: cache domain-containing protein [Desulfobacterales bacterium]|nr:cache domain-containing protein [Desulfobacterales bacterium]